MSATGPLSNILSDKRAALLALVVVEAADDEEVPVPVDEPDEEEPETGVVVSGELEVPEVTETEAGVEIVTEVLVSVALVVDRDVVIIPVVLETWVLAGFDSEMGPGPRLKGHKIKRVQYYSKWSY